MRSPIIKQKTDCTEVYLGKKLKERRQYLKLSQREVAEKLGITLQQIHKYEKGIDRLSASRLFELAKLLAVPISYFYPRLDTQDPFEKQELLIVCTNLKGEKMKLKFMEMNLVLAEIEFL